MRSEEDLVRLSKTVAYALRHDPEAFGLHPATDGSVAVNDLLAGLSKHLGKPLFMMEDLKAVLSMKGKKRFILEDGRIRAYYGHSFKTEVERPSIEPPEVLYHATSHKALPVILKEGLKPMNRQHVHLASTKKTALDAGRRRDSDPPLLQVRAHDAWQDGIHFYQGNEDICMSDPVPPAYISIVED